MDFAANIVVLAGLVIGLIYGAVGLLSGFCMMSSLRGLWAEGDGRLVRTYALAIGVAIAASQLFAARGLVDLGKSIYLQPSFSAPVMFLGGLLFGYGMVMSNGCGSRALVLLGRGNLRSSVVVIVLGIFAEMTLKGLIAPARIAMVQASQATAKLTSVPALLSAVGLGEIPSRMIAASVLSAALIIFAFAHEPFRKSWGQIAAGLIVGVLVAAGWYATGYLGADDFNPTPVTSLTFIAPIADALQYVMLSTGSTLNFGIVTVFGVFAGSLATALATGRFHLEGYQSPRHMLRSAGGAALMGAGGVMALGCSVGQGLTGLSTLSLASFVAVAGILAGTAIGLRGALRVRPLAAA
ncbi:YeeE/YedE family protein [Bradyrhizobium sp. AZCC 2289]|uniref:YeeE/YedE family protein n=1 Tax=Bradyrhizobium sp. AZCC 2289 TaxID=3117026 RepID=UPI002FF1A879